MSQLQDSSDEEFNAEGKGGENVTGKVAYDEVIIKMTGNISILTYFSLTCLKRKYWVL